MPFDLDSFGQVQDFFGLTASYFLLLPEAGTRSYRKALFDEQGNRTGLSKRSMNWYTHPLLIPE